MPYPVSNEILQEALEYACPFLCPDNTWLVQSGCIYGGRKCYFKNGELQPVAKRPCGSAMVENLLKPRNDWPGKLCMSVAILAVAEEHSGTELPVLPDAVKTGEDYVRSCKFYDKAMELHTAAQDKPLKETIQELKEDITRTQALNRVCKKNEKCFDVKWTGAHDTPRKTLDGGYCLLKTDGTQQSLTEQQYRAMSAGYAHVPPNDPPNILRECVQAGPNPTRVIAAHAAYAHARPADPLSGTRTINGWATCGFAVTNSGPLHGTTSSDVQLGDDD